MRNKKNILERSLSHLDFRPYQIYPLTYRSNQDRISPYNIKQTNDENKERI